MKKASRVIRDVATTPADAGAIQIKFGTAVMEAHVAMIAVANALTGETDYEEMKLARKLRNAVADRRRGAAIASWAPESCK